MNNSRHEAAHLGVAALGAVLADLPSAYIGPGAGLGAAAITMALALGVLLLMIGLVWYPLKRLRKGRATDTASRSRTDGTE